MAIFTDNLSHVPSTRRNPMECINLKQQFGDRYKIEYEESCFAEYGQNARVEDPWLMIIPCQHGEICPWGGCNLAACTTGSGRIVNKLKALPYTTVAQDGDDGANVLFPAEKFDEVVQIMKPRKRRRLSPEHKRKLAEAAAKYWFPRGSESPESTPECDKSVTLLSLDLSTANEANSDPFPEVAAC